MFPVLLDYLPVLWRLDKVLIWMPMLHILPAMSGVVYTAFLMRLPDVYCGGYLYGGAQVALGTPGMVGPIWSAPQRTGVAGSGFPAARTTTTPYLERSLPGSHLSDPAIWREAVAFTGGHAERPTADGMRSPSPSYPETCTHCGCNGIARSERNGANQASKRPQIETGLAGSRPVFCGHWPQSMVGGDVLADRPSSHAVSFGGHVGCGLRA